MQYLLSGSFGVFLFFSRPLMETLTPWLNESGVWLNRNVARHPELGVCWRISGPKNVSSSPRSESIWLQRTQKGNHWSENKATEHAIIFSSPKVCIVLVVCMVCLQVCIFFNRPQGKGRSLPLFRKSVTFFGKPFSHFPGGGGDSPRDKRSFTIKCEINGQKIRTKCERNGQKNAHFPHRGIGPKINYSLINTVVSPTFPN